MKFQICEGNHNAKVIQSGQLHKVLNFQDSWIYYDKIQEKIVRTFLINVRNQIYIKYLFLF